MALLVSCRRILPEGCMTDLFHSLHISFLSWFSVWLTNWPTILKLLVLTMLHAATIGRLVTI